MPDFLTFRMNEKLLGRIYAYRKTHPCLDNININNPKYNKELKCNTVSLESINTYEKWIHYVRNSGKINLKKLNKNRHVEVEA